MKEKNKKEKKDSSFNTWPLGHLKELSLTRLLWWLTPLISVLRRLTSLHQEDNNFKYFLLGLER